MNTTINPAPNKPSVGVLMLNIGSPISPQKKHVWSYLAQFLSDKRVIDIPWLFRYLLLYGVILPLRVAKSASAYKKIWSSKGSPLLCYSHEFAKALEQRCGGRVPFFVAMRYQIPSIPTAIQQLSRIGVTEIVVCPMFPQYAAAATGSALAAVYKEVQGLWNMPSIRVLPPFYDKKAFVHACATVLKETLDQLAWDFVLFSYHGLPERQIKKSEVAKGFCLTENCCDVSCDKNSYCYKFQCYATTRAVAGALDLPKNQFTTSFQSRLGRTPWISPYTDIVMPQLFAQGVRHLVVACPSFVADCLETLEEIQIRAKEDWLALGGLSFALVPSLNAHPAWVDGFLELLDIPLPKG